MTLTEYLESVPGLRSVDRTVAAQAVDPNDNGILKYPAFFPLTQVNTTKVGDITIGNYRPVASRREWNAPGRLIPLRTPDVRDINILPIESYFTIAEEEMQKLEETSNGNESIIMENVGISVESRTDGLAEANWRRVELDAMRVWANGELVQDDPQTGRTVTTDFAFGSDRQQAAGTGWTSVTAYDNLLAWLLDGVPVLGRIEGVQLSSSKYALIKASAPTTTGIMRTREYIENLISDELGNQFRFVQNDDTLETFTDGGLITTPEVVWPVNILAAIPAGGQVGITAQAPVARAGQLKREFGDAGIDRNGVAIYYTSLNEGKGAKVSAQLNVMAIPNKGKIWTIDALTPA